MKQRIVTGAIGFLLLVPLVFFYHTPIFNIVIVAIACMAVFEVLQAAGLHKNPFLLTVCFLYTAAMPFIPFTYTGFLAFFFTIFIFIVEIFEKINVYFERITSVFPLLLIIPFGLSCAVYLRDLNEHAIFYLLLAIIGAWGTDIGAYFAGSFLGKHKLIERISPKKTIEGAIGGLGLCLVGFLLSAVVYQNVFLGQAASISYWMIILMAVLSSLIGMAGDLAASLIKRICHVKDYGSILPGHGGILDRFDSVIFVMPLIFAIVYFIPIIS